LNYDPEDIGEFEDVESLVKTFPKVLDEAFKPFENIKLEDSYECTMAIVRKLSEIDHGKFEMNLEKLFNFGNLFRHIQHCENQK
jgi:type I restriction enzyme R subunit